MCFFCVRHQHQQPRHLFELNMDLLLQSVWVLGGAVKGSRVAVGSCRSLTINKVSHRFRRTRDIESFVILVSKLFARPEIDFVCGGVQDWKLNTSCVSSGPGTLAIDKQSKGSNGMSFTDVAKLRRIQTLILTPCTSPDERYSCQSYLYVLKQFSMALSTSFTLRQAEFEPPKTLTILQAAVAIAYSKLLRKSSVS